jgi:hypothetical protein
MEARTELQKLYAELERWKMARTVLVEIKRGKRRGNKLWDAATLLIETAIFDRIGTLLDEIDTVKAYDPTHWI